MKKIRRFRSGPKADINVTPFIDILLVLLVIFMTITPLTPTGLRAEIPQPPPPNSKPQPQERVLVLSIDQNRVIQINQDEVELAQLATRLRDILKTRVDRTVFVQGDERLIFNDVAQLIDVARAAGAERFGIMTENIGPR